MDVRNVSAHRQFRATRYELSLACPEVRALALQYLLDKAAQEDIHQLPMDAVNALRTSLDRIPNQTSTLPHNREVLEARREAFVSAYGIKHHGADSVEANLRGTSRRTFLLEADELIRGLYGINLLHMREFETWVAPLGLNAPTSANAPTILAHPSSPDICDHVETRVFHGTPLADLLVAHASYCVLTGTDLFNGKRAQGLDGRLCLFHFGLALFPNRDQKPFADGGNPSASEVL